MADPAPPLIRLIGELRLAGSDGLALRLPPSRKTRALLGYLVATGRPHRRERLCDLLWDGPDDPRAELRWSLSKLRPLIEGRAGLRLDADRERIGVDAESAVVDLGRARGLVPVTAAAAPTAALRQAATLLCGELLDGLDLPLCYRFQEWLMAERAAVARLRHAVLSALVARLEGSPDEALVHARALAAADPLSEAGHARVVLLLARAGRGREALVHYEHARRLLAQELGVAPEAELKAARQTLRAVASPPAVPPPAVDVPVAAVPPRSPRAPIVGREEERAAIEHLAASRSAASVLLLTGEPGIGKSRLLAYLADCVEAAGGRALAARAYEAEATRPYGVWIDLLRVALRVAPQDDLPPELSLLLPEAAAPPPDATDRARMFDAVDGLLRRLAAERPLALILDDIQWLDEASSALLHYVARSARDKPGAILACGARIGEIDDNAAASRVLRSLRTDGRLTVLELGPLDGTATVALVRNISAAADAQGIFARSGGNPLFAIALARTHADGSSESGSTLDALVADQMAALGDAGREVLIWAAVLGGSFTPDDIDRVTGLGAATLLSALGELERRGLLRPTDESAHDFVHDLVREAVYRSLSLPRRRLAHRRAARTLAEGGDVAAADLARHAALAEDHPLAARAAILAGDRALRLFANTEAKGFAERGLRHAGRLPDERERVAACIALLRICVLAAAGPGMRPLPRIADAVSAATAAAERLGLTADAATGHYLLSILHQEAGAASDAADATLRAAAIGRTGDTATRAHQLANTARCLLELETQVDRARSLLAEVDEIAREGGLELCELHWGQGLLARWDGDRDAAAGALHRALGLARGAEDRWREYKCLTWLAVLERERGNRQAMEARCVELAAVAARLGENEQPLVATLRALALLEAGDVAGPEVLAGSLAALRAIDDKSWLAYALNVAADMEMRAGRVAAGRAYAREALAVAEAMQRHSEMVIARSLLGLGAAVRPESGRVGAQARTAVDSSNAGSNGRRSPCADVTPEEAIPCPASSSNAASRHRSHKKT
ncbi:transcriptional activator [Stella humosa]|uniref:Transcriptional activator n=1 Tax=Stella humosa TaxID=94 RepID=A0A3N1KQ91_9PROT|nr:AAA family ATPase [Stella humosa]ROP81457.1 transcriptional activator [Stella humosa]BBK32810.1 hypothetical protein STHU_34440 [Stella humosa]